MELADRSEWELYGGSIRDETRKSGERIGRFSLIQLVSVTLFGACYEAQDRNSGDFIYLHVFPSGLRRSEGLADAIADVIERLRAVQNETILTPIEVLDQEEFLGVVFEGFSGARTLTRHFEAVSSGRGLPSDQVRDLLLELAAAVEAAAEVDVHHFTLIPETILVGPKGEIRILGCGYMQAIARPDLDRFVSSAIVPLKRNLEAPGYSSLEVMSPELRNQKEADVRADIYALGMLGYYLLTHLRPVAVSPIPSKLREEIPDDWVDVIARSVEVAPENRHPTIKALRSELSKIGAPTEPPAQGQRPVRRAQRKASFSGRRAVRPGLAGLAAVLALAAGLRVINGFGASEAPSEPVIDEAPVTEETADAELVFGKLRITGHPTARIDVVDGEGKSVYLDRIPESGDWGGETRLLAGSYDLVVSKAGHRPQRFSGVRLGPGAWTGLEAFLEPLPVSLRITSQPPGASVVIDGKRVGVTPVDYESALPGETLTARITADGFRSEERSVQVHAQEDNVLDFGSLEPVTGRLSISIQFEGFPPDEEEWEPLRVWLDEVEIVGRAEFEQSVQAGPHSIEVSHPDYLSQSVEIDVEEGTHVEHVVRLEPRPAELRLLLPVGPRRVFVDDQLIEETTTLTLPPGREVAVVVSVKEFLPLRRTFRLRPNAREQWAPELQPLPGPEVGEAWNVPYLDIAMAWIAAGEFQMGSARTEHLRLPNEGPPTGMRFARGFWVGTTEVAQKDYRRVVNTNPSARQGDDLPVESLTWSEAVRFCEELTAHESATGRVPAGYVYRLPTEAEWEYFARAGTRGPFSFGQEATDLDGNFQGRYPRDYQSAEIGPPDHRFTEPVASYSPNPWGLYDIHGNVREWVYDGYNDRLPGGEQTDFVRLEGRGRTTRGGGWADPANRARSSARDQMSPETRRPSLGFRIVLAPSVEP